MKKKLYLFSALLLYLPIFAQQVSVETAQHVANIFLQKNAPITMNSTSSANATTSGAAIVKPIGRVAQSPVMYAVSQDSVWVLIAADERVTPILAYSDENAGMFPEDEDMSDGMATLLDWYEFQIQYIRDSTNETTIHEGWLAYQNNSSITPDRDEDMVPPLLRKNGEENFWAQCGNNETLGTTHGYNKFCPILNGNAKSMVGCVAVAMGQLMWYWQWPNVAIVEDGIGNSLIREYDWNNMPAIITNNTPVYNVDMIAHLLRDAGMSVNMQYGVVVSGASSHLIPGALETSFGYHSDDVIYRDSYPLRYKWLDSLKLNLLKGYPILYGGERKRNDTTTTGHQFVIDGWQSSDIFHINYGWGGKDNGYYVLDEISEHACTLYPLKQHAILNVHPNYPNCAPIEISQNEVLDTTFIVQNGGEITIGNSVIEDYQTGVIYSGEHITLTPGFHAKLGCNLQIAVRDVPCDNNSIPYSLPQKAVNQHTEVQWCNQWNVLSHGWYGASDEPFRPNTWIYQLGQDTIINNMTYQTLYSYFSLDSHEAKSYIAALRFTEDKQVFILYEGTEYLLYDFDVQVGDTLEIFGGITYYNFQETLPHVVTAIHTSESGRLHIILDAITTDNSKWRKRWIEGIGSLDGIIHNTATTLIGNGVTTVLCAYYNDECLYSTTNSFYSSYGCVYNDPIFSATEEVESPTTSAQKVMQNGQLLIIHKGKTYNIMGVEVGQ